MSHPIVASLFALSLLTSSAAHAKGGAPPPVGPTPTSQPAAEPADEQTTGPKLDVPSTVRAAVSNREPPPAPVGTGELDELRRFEESAFPRSRAAATVTPAGRVEGRAPTPRVRPSAESPPPGLKSDPHPTARTDVKPAPPEPWLAKLQLPDLPLRWDLKLIRYLEFYRSSPKGRAIMSVWLRRLGRYQRTISRTLRRHSLPQDLVYVAMIESGFNPKVTSRRGAAGVWQFMPKAGNSYGLRRDHWIDERRNPELSAEAAAKFLKDLHDRFGTWELALAAYNAGYFGVTRAIQKYNTNDYWQLCRYEAGLPWDTSLYVPKILAAAIVGRNRAFFGFDQIKVDAELSYALVAVPSSVTLSQAAAAAGVGKDLLEQLNPELRRGRTAPSVKGWLRVPKGSEDRFYAGLSGIKGQLARYKPYVVRLGDSEELLASRAGLSRAALRQLNGLERPTDLRPGLTILVPARSAPTTQPTTEGEEELLVALPKDKPSAIPGRTRVFYRVVPGDTLEDIAVHLKVSASDLASWNALDPTAKLIASMVLQAFVAQGFDERSVVLLDQRRLKLVTAGSEAFLNAYEERRGRKRLIYTVRDGDTVSSVSRRFGLSEGSLMRINQFDRQARLKPGQPIVVYVDLAKLRSAAKGKRPPKRRAPASRPTASADEGEEEEREPSPAKSAESEPAAEEERPTKPKSNRAAPQKNRSQKNNRSLGKAKRAEPSSSDE
jgi:membrane-bound lytic murein transglycosylase D